MEYGGEGCDFVRDRGGKQSRERVQPHDSQVDKAVLQSVGPGTKALQTATGYESGVTGE